MSRFFSLVFGRAYRCILLPFVSRWSDRRITPRISPSAFLARRARSCRCFRGFVWRRGRPEVDLETEEFDLNKWEVPQHRHKEKQSNRDDCEWKPVPENHCSLP